MKLKTNKLIEEINNIGNFEEKDRGTAPVSYSDAVRRLRKKQADTEKACEEHKKEALKDTNELDSTDDSRFNHKVPKTPDLKKMHLSESLFEDWEEENEDGDKPFTKAQVYDELKRETNNFAQKDGYAYYDFESEATMARDILEGKCGEATVEKTEDKLVPGKVAYKVTWGNGKLEEAAEAVATKLNELKGTLKDILKNHLKLKKDKIDSVLDKVTKDIHHDNIYEIFLGRLALGDAEEVIEKLKFLDSLYVLDSYGPGYIKVAFKKDFEKDPFAETPLTEAEVTDKDIIRDYFADSIVEALDNIFVKAYSATKVPQSEEEFDSLKIDKAIDNLADELAKAYLGIDNLDEATRKDRGEVIRQALRRKGAENKKLTEDVDVPADTQEGRGVADMLNDLIIDEFEAITGYNNAISTITSIDAESSILKVLDDIIKEENVHVGQLQAALKEVSDAAHEIEKGNNEGDGQLGTPEVEVTEEVPEEIKSSFEDEHIG